MANKYFGWVPRRADVEPIRLPLTPTLIRSIRMEFFPPASLRIDKHGVPVGVLIRFHSTTTVKSLPIQGFCPAAQRR